MNFSLKYTFILQISFADLKCYLRGTVKITKCLAYVNQLF